MCEFIFGPASLPCDRSVKTLLLAVVSIGATLLIGCERQASSKLIHLETRDARMPMLGSSRWDAHLIEQKISPRHLTSWIRHFLPALPFLVNDIPQSYCRFVERFLDCSRIPKWRLAYAKERTRFGFIGHDSTINLCSKATGTS
jgi:hypothetical protein